MKDEPLLTTDGLRAMLAERVREVITTERAEAIYREEIASLVQWRTASQACEMLQVSPNTFVELADKYGLPKSQLADRVCRYFARDIEALMLRRLVEKRGKSVIDFPSLRARAALTTEAA